MKKLYYIIFGIGIILLTGCEKDEECDCFYSEHFDQYFHHEFEEEIFIESIEKGNDESERLEAVNAECLNKGCN